MNSIPRNSLDVILLDIEGTTTPIDYVYGTLFPYVREHLAAYLEQGMDSRDLQQLSLEYQQETSDSLPPWSVPPTAYLLWLMDQDRKSPGLKSVQGKIWEAGYQQGLLQGVVFEDVPRALQTWHEMGIRVFIYSSGSVLAQKLLFRNSTAGNLTPWLEGYFDTEVGSKRESSSYKEIAQRLQALPERCLFISDLVAECQAAAAAGFQVLHSLRPGNPPATSDFAQITDFTQVIFL
jgi:enolase-phosphatase E1